MSSDRTLPLACDINALLLSHWQWFAEATLGCIGILSDWLTDTTAAILAKGGTVLTHEELARHMLPEATRLSLELEARAGERKLADGQAKSIQDLAAFLGQTGIQLPLPTRPQPPTSSVDVPSQPEQKPFERAPTRDPVGETVTFQENKCPFAGLLSLSGEDMRASGVFRVECPVCLLTRSLTPKGVVVHFPTHGKRKTSRPHQEKRWVQNEAEWKLAGQ